MQNYKFNCFYDVVTHNANHKPNKIIIFEEDLKITNLQFKKYIDTIANYLSSIGIKPNDKVALVMSNSWQFVVNIFAISKIGAIPVPVNNFFKSDELAYVINDVQAKLLFSSGKYLAETKDLLIKTNIDQIVWVDDSSIENEKNINYDKIFDKNDYVECGAHPSTLDGIASILYTSGTTGKPKGAMLTFRNIFSNCEGVMKVMKAKDGQACMICYLPMFHAFTLTVTVILPIYTNSGLVVIRSISTKNDFKKVLKQLLLKRCKYFAGVPEIFNAMSKAKLPWYFHWFHNVRGFICGAAPLSEEIITRFNKSFKRGKLLEGYGITECSPVVSCNSPEKNKSGSVGQPLSGYAVKIFDDNMNMLSTGDVGEICVQGDCVMNGYYNKPEDTTDAIVNGWFKTGDIGKIDDEGYVFIIDRKKDLIIHKGMNIYPREIEEVIYTHQKVNSCAVIGITEDSVEFPVAYVELIEHEELKEAELKEFIKPHLAAFKCPRRIYFVDKLPRNATGKILKRELRGKNK